MTTTLLTRLLATRAEIGPLLARIAAGVVFVSFSVGKFTSHDSEAAAFDRYGIPYHDTLTYLVGVLELGGGLALLAGFLTRPAALALAANVGVAIGTAGRIDGGPVHLGLAPALLVTMLFLVWRGGGARSVDGRITRSPRRPTKGVGQPA